MTFSYHFFDKVYAASEMARTGRDRGKFVIANNDNLPSTKFLKTLGNGFAHYLSLAFYHLWFSPSTCPSETVLFDEQCVAQISLGEMEASPFSFLFAKCHNFVLTCLANSRFAFIRMPSLPICLSGRHDCVVSFGITRKLFEPIYCTVNPFRFIRYLKPVKNSLFPPIRVFARGECSPDLDDVRFSMLYPKLLDAFTRREIRRPKIFWVGGLLELGTIIPEIKSRPSNEIRVRYVC